MAFTFRPGIFLPFLALCPCAVAAAAPSQKQVTVVLRYDDFSAKSDTRLEARLVEAFHERKLKCTFGVVPFICAGDLSDSRPQELLSLPPEKVELLRDAIETGIVEPALHGFSHQTNGMKTLHSEFSGLEYAQQFERIKRGKDFLERQLDMRVDVFCPPWHSYDAATIKALEDASFRYISASFEPSVGRSSSLRFLPATCDIIHLRQAMSHARKSPDNSPVIVVLFHPYDFMEVDPLRGVFTYDDFLGMLEWLVRQQDVCVKSIAHAQGLAADDYFKLRNFFAKPRILPEGFWGACPTFVLLSPRGRQDVIRRYYMGATLLHGSVFAVCAVLVFFGAVVFSSNWPALTKFCMNAGTILAVAIVALVLADLKLGFTALLVSAVACGGFVGIQAARLKVRRRPQP
jgi:hypothetical protein